jgi:outer membrane protein assembly factor BamE
MRACSAASVYRVLKGAGMLAGCASWVGHNDRFAYVVPLYKVEIVQGNVVTKEQASQVKPGMTREQVRAVLGSPLLTDPFHANRWDYVFTIRRQGTAAQQLTRGGARRRLRTGAQRQPKLVREAGA